MMQKLVQIVNPNSTLTPSTGNLNCLSFPLECKELGLSKAGRPCLFLTREACAPGLQVPPLTQLSCGSYTHMPAIQSFGVCVDICVCEEKRVLVLRQDMIQGPCWYAVRSLLVKPTRRMAWTHSLLDPLGYNLFPVYNYLQCGSGSFPQDGRWNQNQQLLNNWTILRREFSSKHKSF